MRLGPAAESARGWRVRTGVAETTSVAACFRFPVLGAPWEHNCTALRSSIVTVDVVVAAWNSADSLGACLDTIALSSLNRLAPQRLRVLICDDGSTDSTQIDLRARQRSVNLHVVRQDHRSQAFAVNTALTRADADVLVFCDADMLLGCGALDEIAARHELWPDVACAGFRSDIEPGTVPRDSAALATLAHREALSGDNRVRFHMPTLVPNMMHATRWLTRLGSGRFVLDCEGARWLRHRYAFGCLLSAGRTLVTEAGGMPEIVPGWGYQDSLLVARLEAAGAFVLPVTTAWGHHVAHRVRHADQWFQYRRNGLAYAELLGREISGIPWRAADGAPAVREEWSASRSVELSTPALGMERATPELLHALGLWQACLEALDRAPASPRRAVLADECRLSLGMNAELAAAPAAPSLWHALAVLRLGRATEARLAFRHCAADDDPVAAYARSASVLELARLAEHFAAHRMPDVARLHDDVALLLDPTREEAV